MVYLLKEPVGDSKGILVFTHKERTFLDPSVSKLRSAIRELKEEYVLGMHWGMYSPDTEPVPYIDFHLARENTVQFTDEDRVRRIPLASYNFIPARFREFDSPTEWDILSVGHPTERKRNSDLLGVIRDLYDDGLDVSALFIAAKPKSTTGVNIDEAFFDIYENEFTDRERRNITIASPVRDDDLFPIPNDFFPFLYNASKISALFSRAEGNPKVVHESLLCGTPVMVRDDMDGSGQDYLTNENSAIVSDLDEAKSTLRDMIERPSEHAFDPTPLREEICEESAVPKLEAELERLFDELGVPFEGELRTNDLWKCLPSHHTTIPRELRRQYTSDLQSRSTLYQYTSSLLGRETSALERGHVGVGSVASKVTEDGFVKRKVSNILQQVDAKTNYPLYQKSRTIYQRVR